MNELWFRGECDVESGTHEIHKYIPKMCDTEIVVEFSIVLA
jgi:hypothetical protein